jgi:hypothetical protein
MVRAREHNPSIAFLGVVLFGINSSATKVLGNIREYFEGDLKGVAEVFATAIRHVEAAAVACRTNGLVPQELAERTDRDVAPPVMTSVVNLAKDYRSLTIEVLTRISTVNGAGGADQ